MDEAKPRAAGGVPYVSHKEKIGTAARDAQGRFAAPDPAAQADRIRRAAAKSGGPERTAGSTRRRSGPAMPPPAQGAERARQALLGWLLGDGKDNPAGIDEARLRDSLAALTPDDAARLGGLLDQVRRGQPSRPASGSGSPLLGRVEEELAARGIRLELRGQTNNIYIAGDNPTWNVGAAPDSPAPAAETAAWKGSRAGSRNSWGYQFGRTVRNFINGH